MDQLKWTGERYLPWVDGGEISYEHLHRYRFVKEFIKGKNVLDLACGEGYGSFMLCEDASSVIGVDIDPASIKHASSKYLSKNAKFIVGSILEVPIRGRGVFDVMVCFEALEHIAEHYKLMDEVKRLLKPEGFFIVSTPNKYEYSDIVGYENPFHIKELYPDEFKGLLLKYFKKAYLYGQRVYSGSKMFPMFDSEGRSQDFVIKKDKKEISFLTSDKLVGKYILAIASDAILNPSQLIASSFLIDSSNALLKERDRQIAELESRVREQEHNIQSKDSLIQKQMEEIRSRHSAIKRQVREFQPKNNLIREQARLIKAKEEVLVHTQAELYHVYKSTSWRITYPLRLTVQFLRSISKIIRKTKLIIRRCFYWLYHNLPLSEYDKYRLESVVYKNFGFARKRLELYRNWLVSAQSVHGHTSPQFDQAEAIDLNEGFEFEEVDNPVVSVIIHTDSCTESTFRCLKSIYNNAFNNYEIIIVDDCSQDSTQVPLSTIHGVQVVRNHKKLGFVRSCNRGASIARGEYLLFLKNHTVVLPHWMEELVDTFAEFPDTGLVGSKLIYPNGLLRSAGGIIWNDSSVLSYGLNDDSLKPKYCYSREVDYCSTSIMVPRKLFDQLGGFDEKYMSGYYGQADLSLSIRETGRKVLYQPLSRVVCHESSEYGADCDYEIKAHQEESGKRFYMKWVSVLAGHGHPGKNLHREKERTIQHRILIIDPLTPTPDQDSGSVDSFSYMKILRSLSFGVTFIPAENLCFMEKYTADLQRIGVECLYLPYVRNITGYLKKYGRYYDIVLLYRALCAGAYIDSVKKHCPSAKIIFDTVDLHYLREQRQAVNEGSQDLAKRAERTKRLELSVIKKSDCTIVLSQAELEILKKEPTIRGKHIAVVPLIRDIPGIKNTFKERSDILFIGGYKHDPNVDAVLYFAEKIWPLVKEKIPELKFYIIGSNVPQEIGDLSIEDVIVVGYVEDISDYFNRCRLSIAPLRYGAGIKGKIGASMAYGVPCVASPIAVEGSGFRAGKEIIVADGPEEFADGIAKVYYDENLWNQLSINGLSFARENYSIGAGRKQLLGLFRDIGVIQG